MEKNARKIRKTGRSLKRSLIVMNPQNFDGNGNVIVGDLRWVYSNAYKENYRKLYDLKHKRECYFWQKTVLLRKAKDFGIAVPEQLREGSTTRYEYVDYLADYWDDFSPNNY